jgi:endo-1,4-beta-xylanase
MKQNLFFRKGMKFLSTGISYSAIMMLLFAGCTKETVAPVVQENNSIPGHNYSQLKSTGTDHGYWWQCYVSSGSATITFPNAGTYAGNYAVTWTNVGDVVAGKGWSAGSASRTVNYNCGSLSGSYNNFSVYGWTTSPLIEYYVCEKGSVATGSAIGTLSSDGHTYTVYKHQQVSQPSIQGTATFWQYLSNWGGTTLGANHAVTVANHVNYWKAHIGSMGTFNYQIMAIEAYSTKSGSINCTVW